MDPSLSTSRQFIASLEEVSYFVSTFQYVHKIPGPRAGVYNKITMWMYKFHAIIIAQLAQPVNCDLSVVFLQQLWTTLLHLSVVLFFW